MSNHNLNIFKVENKYISSTPKFSQTLQDKETVNKNNSFDLDLPSLEDNKFSTEKKDRPIFIDKESKDNNNINFFRENFSICSILNENNEEKNFNNINIDNEINNNKNNKTKLINININNPNNKKRKNERKLISFGDKSDNENNSLNNNEILYREKINNSSIISNKEKENDKENNKEIQDNKENENENNLLEKKNSSNLQNNNNSFQYSLPLENDMAPNITDFFIYDEENNNSIFNDKNEMKENNLNNSINEEKIIKIGNESNKIDKKNNNENNNITYSKKKAKRSKTERQSITYKILPTGDILDKIEEKDFINSETKNKNNIFNYKINLINSCENTYFE